MTLAATVSTTGISSPTYADILAAKQAQYQAIYGSDIVITPDSMDGQAIAIEAQAVYDANQMAIAVYNSLSPATAQGAGLSSVVKINGLQRKVPTASTAVVAIVGVAGTTIANGLVGDNLSQDTQWALPATVTIPPGGSISVTATCTTLGAVNLGSATLTRILSPTYGWQTVTNAAATTAGQPVETDPELKARQAVSTSLAATGPLSAIVAAVANTAGVGRVAGYENPSATTDSNGIPPYAISIVAEGGNVTAIAEAIASKKIPGPPTYGSTSHTVVDPAGVSNTIHFYELTDVPITMTITIKALTGYLSSTGDIIKAAVAKFINDLTIGEDSYLFRLSGPTGLTGSAALLVSGLNQSQLDDLSSTYYTTAVLQARTGSPAASNVTIAFNEAATTTVSLITLNVT